MSTMNVLFLLSDEQDGRVLGCAGHPFVRTPNLDRLAEKGTRFANAFTPSPICVPARAALATGRWVHEIGYWDNALAYDGKVEGWGHHLIAEGHRVESIGKLHYVDESAPTGFSRQHQPIHLAGGIGQVWGSVRDPLPETPRPSKLFTELGAGESRYNQFDMSTAKCAADWLRHRGNHSDDKPWMLFVGFVAPHFPLVVPQEYLDLCDIESLPLPKLHPSTGYRRHPWVQRHADFYDADAELGTDARRRLALAAYYGLVSFLDRQVGMVLDALDACGLAESTLVVFSSDHGDNQGARGMWNKSTLYRESTNVPLILAGPGIPSGKVCDTNVNLIDLAPTILDAMGVPIPDTFSGRSLLEIANQDDDRQRIGFSEYHAVGSPSAGYMLRHGRMAYHHYVGYPPELFDLVDDPEQLNDIAADPAYESVLAMFEGLLRERLEPDEVDRRAKRDQNALVERFGGREAALKIGPQGATPAPGE